MGEKDRRHWHPDYFLVLPWHFLPEFIKREQAWLQRGGQFIVPLPEFKIIGWKDGITHSSVASAKSQFKDNVKFKVQNSKQQFKIKNSEPL